MKCQKYEQRYAGNATVTKHSFPKDSQVGEMRNKMASVTQSDVPPTSDQKVTGLIPVGSCKFFFFRLIMKSFLQSLSPFC